MPPFRKKCCNPLHNAWNCLCDETKDLAKIGGLQACLAAFAQISENFNTKAGSVFCLDCLFKCRSKRSFTEHLPPEANLTKVNDNFAGKVYLYCY